MKIWGKDMDKTNIIKYFSKPVQKIFNQVSDKDFSNITEIRFRADKPILVNTHMSEYSLTETAIFTKNLEQGFIICSDDILKTIDLLSNFSMYSFEKEIKNGYITIKGGHRVGIAGTSIVESGQIKTIKDFSSINIRIAKQVIGASDKTLDYLVDVKTNKLQHTLIISPPACGKTTLLRDIIRSISYGYKNQKGINIGVIDERQEIAASYMGVPQNDLGPRTDVLDNCPKVSGMLMLLRAMSPKVIAVDELGTPEDIEAVETIINSGVCVIATAHGHNIEDIKQRKNLKEITSKNLFDRYIVLNPEAIGKVLHIYDKDFELIYTDNNIKHIEVVA